MHFDQFLLLEPIINCVIQPILMQESRLYYQSSLNHRVIDLIDVTEKLGFHDDPCIIRSPEHSSINVGSNTVYLLILDKSFFMKPILDENYYVGEFEYILNEISFILKSNLGFFSKLSIVSSLNIHGKVYDIVNKLNENNKQLLINEGINSVNIRVDRSNFLVQNISELTNENLDNAVSYATYIIDFISKSSDYKGADFSITDFIIYDGLYFIIGSYKFNINELYEVIRKSKNKKMMTILSHCIVQNNLQYRQISKHALEIYRKIQGASDDVIDRDLHIKLWQLDYQGADNVASALVS